MYGQNSELLDHISVEVTNDASDVAVIQIPSPGNFDITTIPRFSVGDPPVETAKVSWVGHPDGQEWRCGTVGIEASGIEASTFLFSEYSQHQGISGGPVFDERGKVVGLVAGPGPTGQARAALMASVVHLLQEHPAVLINNLVIPTARSRCIEGDISSCKRYSGELVSECQKLPYRVPNDLSARRACEARAQCWANRELWLNEINLLKETLSENSTEYKDLFARGIFLAPGICDNMSSLLASSNPFGPFDGGAGLGSHPVLCGEWQGFEQGSREAPHSLTLYLCQIADGSLAARVTTANRNRPPVSFEARFKDVTHDGAVRLCNSDNGRCVELLLSASNSMKAVIKEQVTGQEPPVRFELLKTPPYNK